MSESESINDIYLQAVDAHTKGDLNAAQPLYMQVLKADPNHADALCRLGILANQVGRPDVALKMLHRAVELRPDSPEFRIDLGNVLSNTGQQDAAAEMFRKAMELNPKSTAAMNNLANTLRAMGRLDESIDIYRQSIEIDPNDPLALNNLGNALDDKGQIDDAIGCYLQAIEVRPDFAEAYHNLASAQRKIGQTDEAIDLYRKALELRPTLFESWQGLGVMLKDKGELKEALQVFDRMIQMRPDLASVHNDRGVTLADLGRLDEAIASYQKSLQADPQFAFAYNNLGNALRAKGQFDAAITAFHRAIEIDPNYAEAHNSLAVALSEACRFEEAIALLQRARELAPQNAWIQDINLGHGYWEVGLLDEAIASYRKSISANNKDQAAQQNLLFSSHYMPSFGAADIHREHLKWVERFAAPLASKILPYDNDKSLDRKLKIGYVSPNFREHPISFFIEPILANHDKSKVEVVVFSGVGKPDRITERLRGYCDAWHDVRFLSDDELADLIRRERIDILVDLSLHMEGNRMLVFARKPAPVQVTYLGYPASTGLPTMDYRLTDHYLDPAKTGERYDIEQVVRLPQSYFCYQPREDAPEVGPLPTRSSDYVTFASLNNLAKVTPAVMTAWAEILQSVPDARLLMKARGMGSSATQERVREFFASKGVESERLELQGWSDFPEFMSTLNQCDLCLDTFPFNGGTTSCHALWMGLPVVSLAGTRAVSRMGLSILSNIGLENLVTQSTKQYIALAIDLADHPDKIEVIRKSLREKMRNSPLMNAKQFTADLEAAYRKMWTAWVRP